MNDETVSKQNEESQEHEGHVHGPNCNHDHPEIKPFKRTTAKIGRNDPCLCGSNKKYKKCCGK
jgi:uncharacterized protein YecA (UPF0149 family)